MLTVLSQNDPRWAGIKIGASNLTIGRWGCAYTSLVNIWMALTGKTISPKQFIAIAKNPKNFTDKYHKGGAGLILWDKVCAALGGIAFKGAGSANLSQIYAAIKTPARAVIVQVNKGAHFTAGWRVPKDGKKDVIVADPWNGKVVSAVGVYHSITSTRYFERIK